VPGCAAPQVRRLRVSRLRILMECEMTRLLVTPWCAIAWLYQTHSGGHCIQAGDGGCEISKRIHCMGLFGKLLRMSGSCSRD